ncbi:hypothetical protein ACJMK2_006136 [Sinanodonta woodiana]|uniref:RRM domain-containing protein n=1 Tax=Sinanodonta woodiana TaxID=1069815 RepID=A0ABD3VS78_SINWO
MSNDQWSPYTQPYITYPGSEPRCGSFQAQPSYDGYNSLPPLIYPHTSNTPYPDRSSVPNLAYPGPLLGTQLPPLQYPHTEGVSVGPNYGTNQTELAFQHIGQPANFPKTPSAPLLDDEENNGPYLGHIPTKQDGTDGFHESFEDRNLNREVEVSEIPEKATTGMLLNVFENERKGGGPVTDFKYNESGRTTVVEFESPENRSLDREVEVSQIPEKATKDMLLNFFENERKGGGPVADIKYNESDRTAIVTFESPESINTLLIRQPCILQGRAMIIRARTYTDEDCLTSSVSAMTCATTKEDNSELKYDTNSIFVSGFKNTTSEDNLIYYFENKKRSGGGEVSSYQMNRDEGYISITFVQITDAAEVMRRSHTIDGESLIVRPYVLDEKTVLVTGLTGTISEDTLLNFMEVKAKTDVKFVLLSGDKTKAVVEFEHPCDFHQIKEACAKYKLEGVHLHVDQIPKCSSVKVTSLQSNITKDALRLYFENNHRSGGGTVERVELDPSTSVCLIYFQDPQVVEEVCRRSHVIENTRVGVYPYHRCLGKLKVEKNKDLPT